MFQGILGILYGLRHRNPHIGDPVKTLFDIYLQVIVFLVGSHFTEIVRHAAHIFGNGHFIII